MIKKTLEKVINEILKDVALRFNDLNLKDRQSLLVEYREWIVQDIDFDEILMLPYEAYTHKFKKKFYKDK